MKPIIIIPPDVISPDGIEALRANDLCVVVATDPSKVHFLDPIPAMGQRTQMENAAIQLSRKLLNGQGSGAIWKKEDFANLYCSLLIQGTSLSSEGTDEERRARIFAMEKDEETRRLARVEANAKLKQKSETKK